MEASVDHAVPPPPVIPAPVSPAARRYCRNYRRSWKSDLSRGSAEAAGDTRVDVGNDLVEPPDLADTDGSLSVAAVADLPAGTRHCSKPDLDNTADR